MSKIRFPWDELINPVQMGLKPLDPSDWIEVDADRHSTLERKKEILKNHADQVLKLRENCEEACFELAEKVQAQLSHQYQLSMQPPQARNAAEVLKSIALSTQEDWVILSSQAPVVIEAACVCFPSRWDLKEKIGKNLMQVHSPVPKFETIAKPTQGFLERVSVERPMQRLNWTIHDSNEWFAPFPQSNKKAWTPETVLDHTWLRLEKQTLLRLPRTKAVVFSIRTTLHPMIDVVAVPEQRQHLLENLQKLSSETAEYKGLSVFLPNLLAALRE